MGSVDLRLGDCLDVLPGLAAVSIDAIITDLPYGTTDCAWDSVIPLQPMWEAVRRVLKPSGVFVTTASQPFTSALVMSNIKMFRYAMVWEKSSSTGFLDANRKPLKAHEDICVFYQKQCTYNPQKLRGQPTHFRNASKTDKKYSIYSGTVKQTPADVSGMKFPRSVVQFSKHQETENLHPSQKPVALLSYLVATYTNPGDTVADIAMGSGTTGVACVGLQRNFLGVERDPGYFAIAQRRIEQARAQLVMPLFESAA